MCLLIIWIYCCKEKPEFRFMKTWRTRAESFALYLKLLITPLVCDFAQRRRAFYRIDVLIDAVYDFIVVHGGSVQRARDAFTAVAIVSGAKARLELAVKNFLDAIPARAAEHIRVLDPVRYLLS